MIDEAVVQEAMIALRDSLGIMGVVTNEEVFQKVDINPDDTVAVLQNVCEGSESLLCKIAYAFMIGVVCGRKEPRADG